MRRTGAVLVALLLSLPGLALAQMDSREGIALQNQILQLLFHAGHLAGRQQQPGVPPSQRGTGPAMRWTTLSGRR